MDKRVRAKPSAKQAVQRHAPGAPERAGQPPSDASVEAAAAPEIVRLQSIVGNRGVQRLVGERRIQRAVNAQLQTETAPSAVNDLQALCSKFGIKKTDLIAPIKTALFQGNLFPQAYKDAYDQNKGLQYEMRQIVFGLDDLIGASASPTVITAASGQAQAVATQLFAILSPSINAARLRQYEYYRNADTLGQVQGTHYIGFLNLISSTLEGYKGQFDQYDYSEHAKKMRNRIQQFSDRAKGLLQRLNTAITGQQGPDVTNPIIEEINQFRDELTAFEHAWDLDFLAKERDLESTVERDLAQNADLGDKYQVGGGTDDGMNVGNIYNPNLACTLFAILAVKPGWLGAQNASDLHRILRKTGELKDYDDDRTAAKIRYLAGLKPTMVGGENKKVGEYLQGKKNRRDTTNIIIDAEGIAHTFAAAWRGNEFKKVDEATPGGGSFGEYVNKRVLTVWKE